MQILEKPRKVFSLVCYRISSSQFSAYEFRNKHVKLAKFDMLNPYGIDFG